jgi:hypothetical protein
MSPVEEHGDHIISFTDFHEFLDWQAKRESEANERVQDFQKAIKPGDLVWRVVEFGQPLLILGRTHEPEAWYAEMLPKYGEEDARYEADHIAERFTRGYVFGTWYSMIEKEGELGDAHISTLGPPMPPRMWNSLLEMIQAGINPLQEES